MNFQSYLIYNRYRFKNLYKTFTFKTMTIDEINKLSRNQIYTYFLDYFYFHSKSFIRKHRNYFKINKRGYGEDAFHGMWDFLFFNYKPKLVLEIGVYRGQTLSLFNYLSDYYQVRSEVWGVSPLTSVGDNVSNYIDINYEEDIVFNFNNFNLKKPNIFIGHSDSDIGKNFIQSKKWDLIYIDGSHEYETVKQDVDNCIKSLNKKGLLILDDSSLYTDFNLIHKDISTFKGHEGPSKLFEELIKDKKLNYLFGVGHNNIFQNN